MGSTARTNPTSLSRSRATTTRQYFSGESSLRRDRNWVADSKGFATGNLVDLRPCKADSLADSSVPVPFNLPAQDSVCLQESSRMDTESPPRESREAPLPSVSSPEKKKKMLRLQTSPFSSTIQKPRWASPPAKRPNNLTPIAKSFDARYSLQLRPSDRIEEESSPKKLFTRSVVPCVQELQNIVNDCNSFRRNTRLINKRISLGERRIQKRE